MPTEPVSAILFLDENLHCVLAGGGHASYQHIYREARSVYWDPAKSSFTCSRSSTGLSFLELFRNIVRTAKECGITLSFPSPPAFDGLPDEAVQPIRAEIGI
jgi:hypothetical protein